MALLGVRSLYGTLPTDLSKVSDGAVASGVIAAGNFVTLGASTGKLGAVADNGTTAYGVTQNASAAGDTALSVIPGGDNIIFRMTYAGSDPGITNIGDFVGTDGAKPDLDNTSNKLLKLVGYGTDVNSVKWVDVVIPSSICEAQVEVS